MRKGDYIVYIVMTVLTIGFAAAGFVTTYQEKQANALKLKKQEIAMSPEQVIGSNAAFKGKADSPYTLVEFGDYECPPCRALNQQLPSVLDKYQGTVRFTFRNFPLTKIHPAAMPAALAAEAARPQGKFWLMHDSLYDPVRSSLDVSDVKKIIKSLPLDQRRFEADSLNIAKQSVKADVKEVEDLGLTGTPSFVLCCPNKKVIRLDNIGQIDTIVSQ